MADVRYVYLFDGRPQYDTGSGLEERQVRFFSGPVDGLLSTGSKAHIGLSQQLSARVQIDHILLGGEVSSASTQFGEVTIEWGDGDYDAFFRPPYYWRGQPFYLERIALEHWPGPSGFESLFEGVVADLRYGIDTVSLVIRDRMLSLERRLQQRVYAGTGNSGSTAEGPVDLTDVLKPVLLGTCRNLEPVSLGDDAIYLYQFHDGEHLPAEAVLGVFDKGFALDACDDGTGDGGNPLTGGAEDFADFAALKAWTPIIGEYATCLSAGLIRLGTRPAGRITMDAQGDALISGFGSPAFSALWHRLIRQVAVNYAFLSSAYIGSSITSGSFAQTVGFYSGTQPWLCSEVIRQIAESAFGFAAFDRESKLQIGQFAIGSVAATIYEWQILEIEALRTPMPADPIRCGHTRAWTVQDGVDLVPATNATLAARHALVRQEHRYVQIPTGAADYYPETKARTLDSLLTNDSHATGILVLALALQAAGWRRMRVLCEDHVLARKVGETVSIQFPRFGFASGMSGIVLAVTDNLADEDTELVVLVPHA